MATSRQAATKRPTKNNIKEPIVDTAVKEEKPIIPKDVDPTTIITVKNGFQGKLVYTSSRTKETYIWDSFGDEQEMELRELRNAKSSAKQFFANNWFMFNDEDSWVVQYLGLNQYYKYAIKLEDFDDIYSKDPEEIKSVVDGMSVGQRKSLSYRTRELVSSGEIDSRKVISALEEALNIELIER